MSMHTDARQWDIDRQMEKEFHHSEFLRHHPEYAAPAAPAPATPALPPEAAS